MIYGRDEEYINVWREGYREVRLVSRNEKNKIMANADAAEDDISQVRT
jgi:hypothetical protein